jgi:hypothetical protein
MLQRAVEIGEKIRTAPVFFHPGAERIVESEMGVGEEQYPHHNHDIRQLFKNCISGSLFISPS